MKNKGFLKGTTFGMVLMLLLGMAVPVVAKTFVETIKVQYTGVKLVVNGVDKTPTMSQPQPFLYGSTTFVPLRFVVEALGEEVTWDEELNAVFIGKRLLTQEQKEKIFKEVDIKSAEREKQTELNAPKTKITNKKFISDPQTPEDGENNLRLKMGVKDETVTYIGFEDFGVEAVYWHYTIKVPIEGGNGVSIQLYVSMDDGKVYEVYNGELEEVIE